MNNFTPNYEKILETLQSVESRMNFLNQKPNPQLSDSELIAIDLIAEFFGVDSERDLCSTNRIRLEVPMQRNQHNYKAQDYIFRKSRKRIETLYSQLCDQFRIRRNYPKSFDGSKNRILSKIMPLTIIQYMNKLNN